MRFPWLQVDADFIGAHAADLGALLGISRREAMGLALDLWTWALARSPDDVPPEGNISGTGPVPDRLLAGAVGWTGSVEVLSGALLACGLMVKTDGGYRLTGFDRYKATWEKNRRRTGGKPEGNRTGTGEEPARKTQTQTQTQKETTPPSRAREAQVTGQLADDIAAEFRTTDASWAWDSAKEQVMRALLGKGAPAEIVRRLRIARARKRFPFFTSLGDLVRHWDVYATAEADAPPGKPPRRDINPNDYREGTVERL